MRTRYAVALAAVVLAGSIWPVGASEGNDAPAQAPSAMDQLRSEMTHIREKAAEQLLAQRSATIEGLLKIVRDATLREENPDAVAQAIDLLGKMHAVEAADTLVRTLEFGREPLPQQEASPGHAGSRARLFVNPSSPVFWRTPAVEALIAIGSPALPAVLRFVSSGTANRLELNHCTFVLGGVEGKRRGVIYLEEALAEAKAREQPYHVQWGIRQVLRSLRSMRPETLRPGGRASGAGAEDPQPR